MKNKNNSPYLLLQLITLISIFQIACNRVPGENQDISHGKRIVCVSKQYNEIIFALHADSSLVGVDLSSTFPPEIKKIPSVGYHRALSTEGILSVKPDLIIHDNNIGPDHVLDQLQKLKIPMRTFGKYANTMEGTDSLIREISKYYHKEIIAEQIIKKLDFDFKFAITTLNLEF
jgi:iron complex transport system substrate-binding protein